MPTFICFQSLGSTAQVLKRAILDPASKSPAYLPNARVFKDSIAIFVAQLLGLLGALLSNWLVAWMVGPEGRGLIYLLQVISGVGLTLLNFGLGPASIFHLRRDGTYPVSKIAAGLLWASVLLGVLPIVLFAALWPWAVPLLPVNLPASYFWLALAVIPSMTLTFNVGYLCLGRGEIGLYNWLRIGPSVLFSSALVFLLFSSSPEIWRVALLWVASAVVPSVYAFALLRNAGGSGRPLDFSGFLRSAFRFGWRSHLGSVTQYLQHRVDIFLVSYFLPLSDVGFYAFAVSLAELLWYLPHAVGTVLMPHVAGSSDDHASSITPLVCRATLGLTAMLSLTLVTASAWLIPWILPVFRPSVGVLWLLLPGVIFASIFKVLASDLNGRGKPLVTFYPAAIALAGCFLGGRIFIPRFGIQGAALVTTAGYLTYAALSLLFYSQIADVPVMSLLLLRRKDLLFAWTTLRRMLP